MNIYLVGGAVRDELMNRPSNEHDWVVLNSTPEEMLAKGYLPVGKDFPVFLHPETKDEYALARTERKTSKGYKGFTFYCAPDVTLESDLARRDLTINAIAKSADGEIIDPFNGQDDIHHKLLRHVSPAFAEDPVRILRVARFAACFSDFNIHPETALLMNNMVSAGEVDALVSERVWRELERALETEAPWRFFEVVTACGASPILFAELDLDKLDLAAMKRATQLSDNAAVRLATCFHRQAYPAIRQLANRLRISKRYAELCVMTAHYDRDFKQVLTLEAEEIVRLLERVDAFRRPKRFEQFLLAAEAGLENKTNAVAAKARLKKAYKQTANISATQLLKEGYQGAELGEALHRVRVTALTKAEAGLVRRKDDKSG